MCVYVCVCVCVCVFLSLLRINFPVSLPRIGSLRGARAKKSANDFSHLVFLPEIAPLSL